MLLKKTLILTTFLSTFALPLIAQADLFTTNNTAEYSVTKVDATGVCSGPFPGGNTPPNKSSTATTGQVKGLCGNKAPCSATIIMAKTYADMLICKGKKIGTAQIDDLETDIVKKVNITDTTYQLLGEGTNRVTINKVSAYGGRD